MTKCPICEKRRPRRVCPGLEASRWGGSRAREICSQCCGEQREAGIDCPVDCTYLVAGHRYEAEQRQPRRRRGQRKKQAPREIAFPRVSISQDFLYRHQVLITALSLFLVRLAQEHGELRDPDVAEALDALAAGYQSLDAGVYYEQPPASVPGKKVYEALKAHLEEFSKESQQRTGASVRPGDVLRALVFLRRIAQLEANGRPKSRRYLNFLRAQLPAEALETQESHKKDSTDSPLIVPGR